MLSDEAFISNMVSSVGSICSTHKPVTPGCTVQKHAKLIQFILFVLKGHFVVNAMV